MMQWMGVQISLQIMIMFPLDIYPEVGGRKSLWHKLTMCKRCCRNGKQWTPRKKGGPWSVWKGHSSRSYIVLNYDISVSLHPWRLAYFLDLNEVQRSLAKFLISTKKKRVDISFIMKVEERQALFISSMRPARIFPEDSANLGEGSEDIEQFWKQSKAAESSPSVWD